MSVAVYVADMARARRIEEPGAVYHVTARGNCGQAIYRDDEDRLRFLNRLERSVAKYRWICLAYCLMTNHYHLVVQTPTGGLSNGMQELNCGYSRENNRRYGRRDHLFRQRFFSVQLKRDSHLLEACRYVVLNPVRARLCRSPAHWRWSSYRACAGFSFAPPFLAVGELLGMFSRHPKASEAAYRRFVAAAADAVSDIVAKA
jgi:REP element-mobilizing transposase RayT